MSKNTIALAADHGGVELKDILKKDLLSQGHDVLDLGTYGDASVDYPDYADAMAAALADGRAVKGIVICGTGIGISIAINRHAHVRAALCHNGLTARLARAHNNANVLALGGRIIGVEVARDCLNEFLKTDFEGGRHTRRVARFSSC